MQSRLDRNKREDDYHDGIPYKTPLIERRVAKNGLCIVIPCQIIGGKNNMGITRSGRHYPKPKWAKWRDEVVSVIRRQLPEGFKPISEPCNVKLYYVAGDKRRRDFPAIVDSIWHCLERAGVVKDDSLLWVVSSSRSYDPKTPFAEIEFV